MLVKETDTFTKFQNKYAEDKKYSKSGDQGYYTGEYRGVVHSTCNFQENKSKNTKFCKKKTKLAQNICKCNLYKSVYVSFFIEACFQALSFTKTCSKIFSN